MKAVINKKRIVFILIVIILSIVAGLYTTYALDVFLNEARSSNYDMSLNFDLTNDLNRQMTIEAGKTKVFDIEIINPYNDSVKYGVVYSLISPETLPEGVTIAQTNLSKNNAQGLVEASSKVIISLIIINESLTDISLSFSV